MNIGLISINMYTHSLNFASVLHTYIFQEFLKDNGIDSTIIDYQPHYYNDYDLKHPLFYHIDHPNNDSEKQNELLKKWKALFYVREIRYEKFMKFINSNYKKTINVI